MLATKFNIPHFEEQSEANTIADGVTTSFFDALEVITAHARAIEIIIEVGANGVDVDLNLGTAEKRVTRTVVLGAIVPNTTASFLVTGPTGQVVTSLDITNNDSAGTAAATDVVAHISAKP